MTQHKVWNSWIFFCGLNTQFMYVCYYAGISVLFKEKSQFLWSGNRFPMAQMVGANHINAVLCQKCRKFVVTFNIFHHSVADLQNCFHFAFWNPLNSVDLCDSVF